MLTIPPPPSILILLFFPPIGDRRLSDWAKHIIHFLWVLLFYFYFFSLFPLKFLQKAAEFTNRLCVSRQLCRPASLSMWFLLIHSQPAANCYFWILALCDINLVTLTSKFTQRERFDCPLQGPAAVFPGFWVTGLASVEGNHRRRVCHDVIANLEKHFWSMEIWFSASSRGKHYSVNAEYV